MMMDERLNRHHLDRLRAFVDAEVRFLIVGAHAVGYHAQPRATGDLDVWVEPTRENARRTLDALAGFGAPLANKRAAGRPKDAGDIDALERLAKRQRRNAPKRAAGRSDLEIDRTKSPRRPRR